MHGVAWFAAHALGAAVMPSVTLWQSGQVPSSSPR